MSRAAIGDWRERTSCADEDPELFFPVAEHGALALIQERAAKAVCAQCRVRAECLAWALDSLSHGVAGGMTETERQPHRRGLCSNPGAVA